VLTTLLDRTADWPAPVVLAAVGLLLLAESGTLAGLLLPGTTLLVTLGWWSAAAGLPLGAPLGVAAVATVGGALRGWRCGQRARTVLPAGPWRERSEPIVRRLESWLAAPGGAVALLAAGHWASAARSLAPRVAGAAGVPLRSAGPALAASGTAWAGTLVLLGREVGPQVASTAQWAPLAVLPVVVGVLLLRRRLTRRRTSAPSCTSSPPASRHSGRSAART
jgi:membrane-associated protein